MGFVIHGGIDGYSRRIMYLHCSCNNKAATVLQLFKAVVEGVENVDVAWYLLTLPGRGPMVEVL